MEEITNIYLLLQQSNGLKVKEIANALNLDKFHVAEIMFSPDCSKYWSQDSSMLWYAIDGAIEVKEETAVDNILNNLPEVKEFDISKYLTSDASLSQSIYLRSIINFHKFSDEETKELISQYRDGNTKAHDMLVRAHQRLVVYISRMFRHRGVSFEDLIQEGNIGLLRAIDKYKLDANRNFEEYAKAWIMQSMDWATHKLPFLVHYPANFQQLHRLIFRKIEKFVQREEYDPSICDLESETTSFDNIVGILKQAENLYTSVVHYESLDDVLYADSQTDSRLLFESKTYYINSLLSTLNRKEKDILSRAFAIGGKFEESLYAIGESYNLTRERVRQIRESSIKKIRIYLGLEKDEEDTNVDSKSDIPRKSKSPSLDDDTDKTIKEAVLRMIKAESAREMKLRAKYDSYVAKEESDATEAFHKKRFYYDVPD